MTELVLQIVRFVNDSQPGWVECEFLDAKGTRHILRDKVPIFSIDHLDENSNYPQPGFVYCEILEQWKDEQGKELARITTARPFDVESLDEISEFVVHNSQLLQE